MSFLDSVLKKDKYRQLRPRRDPESSYFQQVETKLRNHPTYRACSRQEVSELVRRTTKPEELVKYFDLTQEYQCQAASGGGGEVDSLPVQLVLKHHCHNTEQDDIESILLQEYGPLHAYLVIGNLILEWDWKSIVIPHGKPIQDRRGGACTMEEAFDVKEANLLPVKVELLKSEVLAEVARFNKLLYHHPIKRHSHDFVRSVLRAMKVPPPHQLESKLKDYLETLEEKKSPAIPNEFVTHFELDQYVLHNIHSFSSMDKEYLILNYFMLHLVSQMKADNPRRWVCTEQDCKMKILEALIDNKRHMVLNKFRSKYDFQLSTSSDYA